MADDSLLQEQIICSYGWDGRALKRFIVWLLKSWAVASVRRINYVKSYTVVEKQVVVTEEKLLIIRYDKTKRSQLEAFFFKDHPLKSLELSVLFSNNMEVTVS